ncbi:MAG: ATP-binding protein [Sedimentisphaeraceae bacterium JB056]
MLILLLGITAQRYIVAPGFEEIERWFIKNEVGWIDDLINRETQRITELCTDWSVNDNTYNYAFCIDEEFSKNNLQPDTFRYNSLNFIAIVGNYGNVIYSESYDFKAKKFIAPIFEDFKDNIISSDSPLLATSTLKKTSGIAESSHGPVFIAAHPITRKDNSNSVGGVVIMARILDQDFLGDIFSKGGSSLKIVEKQQTDCHCDPGTDTYITNYSNGSYSVCKYIDTVYGQTNYVLQLITPNFIGRHNEKYNLIMTVSTLILGLGGLGITLTIIMRVVVRPIKNLESQIKGMAEKKTLEVIPTKKSQDEISSLAREFNTMVTRIKEDERIRSQIARKLQESNSELQRFAYSVSHDLKEPLRTITSYLQLIELTAVIKDETKQYINFVVDASKRMYTMIEDLLAYSRSNSLDYPIQDCSLSVIAKDIIKELHLIIDETNAVITISELPTIKGYCPLLKQIFRNLITNALKYRKENINPQIRIGFTENEEEYIFSIKDNGKGIDKEYQDKIFEMFQRLENTKSKGSGLGLSICKKVAQRHGGRIWVESQINQGSTFFFTIAK